MMHTEDLPTIGGRSATALQRVAQALAVGLTAVAGGGRRTEAGCPECREWPPEGPLVVDASTALIEVSRVTRECSTCGRRVHHIILTRAAWEAL
jgi:hypothetical protein